jgi:hypothetical protein
VRCGALWQEVHSLRELNSMLGERCSALLQRAGSSGDNLTLLAARLAAAEKERDAAR